jgi:hypothetical protein
MKIPPKVERDPLDLDFPTGLFDGEEQKTTMSAAAMLNNYFNKGSQEKVAVIHPPGPYLDPTLVRKCGTKEEFEKLTLQHFIVFDNRIDDTTEDEISLTVGQENNGIILLESVPSRVAAVTTD